jgi:two-component system, NarL family, response regulator NreC
MIPQKDKSIKVLIVEDHPIMRDGLRSSLEMEADIKVVGATGKALEGIGLALKREPDVVIMDIGLPDMNGVEATREIKAKAPGIQVIALTVRGDGNSAREMLSAGAMGFLSKETFCKELVLAIHAVLRGERYLSKDMAQVVFEDFSKAATTAAPVPTERPLTERERQIGRLMQEGWETKEIARQLGLSTKTVAMHRGHLMAKLGVDTIPKFIKYAISHPL